jgi:hypothetical protein
MAKVEISLPDQLADEATRSGLLSSPLLEEWLREQLRLRRIDSLFAGMKRTESTPDPNAMSPEEVAREVAAMRAERRSGNGH